MKIMSTIRNAIDRMPVGRELFVAFSVVLLLTALVGGVAVFGMARVDKQAQSLAQKWLVGVGLLADVRAGVVEAREFEVKHSRTADKSYHSEYEAKMADAGQSAGKALADYERLVTSDAERDGFTKVSKAWDGYLLAQKRVVALGRDKKQQDAADISEGLGSMAFDETLGALTLLTKFNFDGGSAAAAQSAAVYAQAKRVTLGLLAAALLLGFGLVLLVTRHLVGRLGGEPAEAVQLARAVAQGDLTTQIYLNPGDKQSLMAWLDVMQRQLGEAVLKVRQGSVSVATASGEIAHGNADLNQRTEEQASALEETAASMEELSSTVKQNADNARQANQLALGASTVAIKGGEVVGQVVQTMKGINDSSKKIADIIGVIDGIAFQTNILALNAAVEAARAGEQGRGFAVVASEVRSLAGRSADAAKEIKSLINASVERVEQGTALVDQAGATMTEVVSSIKRVTDIMGEISAASTEQSAGVAQVGEAVSQMDRATQQNASLVEQSAAAAESLKAQAQALVQAVAVFKLGAGEGVHNAAPAIVANANAVERRGPDRARNVTRPRFGAQAKAGHPAQAPTPTTEPAPGRTGTDGEWTSF